MFSNNSIKNAEACRFCWMCRHICPVSNCCGNESWTPHAKGLLISLIERGAEFDADAAKIMYHCTLCDACAYTCASGYKPSDFVREARTLSVVEGMAPDAVLELIRRIEKYGNIFGDKDAGTILRIAGLEQKKTDTLLYIGQTAAAVCPEFAVDVIDLLRKAGIDFTLLRNEPPSGAYLSELEGYTGDVQKLAKALENEVELTGAKTVITLNPADAQIFCGMYKEWGIFENIEIVTITAYLAELVMTGRLNVAKQTHMNISVQEPVKLTRGLDEIKPLKELCAALGANITEMFLNGQMSRCIGTVPFDLYDSATTSKMVNIRIDDAKRLGCSKIIAASPDDFFIMRKYAPESAEILSLASLLNQQT